MANRYVRSVFWLCTFTGLGYGLLVLTTPSEADIEKLRKKLSDLEKNSSEVRTRKEQFVNVLQSATQTHTPLYRSSKSEIDKEFDK